VSHFRRLRQKAANRDCGCRLDSDRPLASFFLETTQPGVSLDDMLREMTFLNDNSAAKGNIADKPFPQARQENNFDLLRLAFATLVLLSHAPEITDGNTSRELLTLAFHTLTFGELAVYGFFLLSGFLIVSSWLRQPGLRAFVEKRILRIFPGFICASLVCAFVVGPLGTNALPYFKELSAWNLLKSLLSLTAPRVPAVFPGTHYSAVNGAMWTISCEFRCYMIVAVFGVLGLLKDRRVWLVSSAVVSCLSVLTYLHPIDVPNSYFLFGCDLGNFSRLLMFFFSGGTFYLYRDRLSFKPFYISMAMVILVLGLFYMLSAPLAVATFGAYLLFYVAFLKNKFVDYIRPSQDISYGVYLYGWPAQKLLLWWFPDLSPWRLFVFSVGLSFLCGLLSWRLVEAPFLRLKRKIH
jgi:peptidoglycan/LPS O-acetylase OafA/YrhL